MKSNKSCGNCRNFLRIRKPRFQSLGSNGLCEWYDGRAITDNSFANKCKYYKGIKYKRNKFKIGEII